MAEIIMQLIETLIFSAARMLSQEREMHQYRITYFHYFHLHPSSTVHFFLSARLSPVNCPKSVWKLINQVPFENGAQLAQL
jgi:hypothetical protein